MEYDFKDLLTGSAVITAIVPVFRINFGENPQGAGYPAIVLNTISSNNQHTMGGPDKLFQGRVQVDCYATTYGAAKALSQAVLNALDGYSGGNFQGIFHAGSRGGREGGSTEADGPFLVSTDFMTHWSE